MQQTALETKEVTTMLHIKARKLNPSNDHSKPDQTLPIFLQLKFQFKMMQCVTYKRDNQLYILQYRSRNICAAW